MEKYALESLFGPNVLGNLSGHIDSQLRIDIKISPLNGDQRVTSDLRHCQHHVGLRPNTENVANFLGEFDALQINSNACDIAACW